MGLFDAVLEREGVLEVVVVGDKEGVRRLFVSIGVMEAEDDREGEMDDDAVRESDELTLGVRDDETDRDADLVCVGVFDSVLVDVVVGVIEGMAEVEGTNVPVLEDEGVLGGVLVGVDDLDGDPVILDVLVAEREGVVVGENEMEGEMD